MDYLSAAISIVTAFAAIVALVISCFEMRNSNRQSLFDRRLNLCVLVKGLMGLYADNRALLQTDRSEPFMGIETPFLFLTNNSYLYEMSAVAKNPDDGRNKILFLSKIGELKRSSYEVEKVFKGGDANRVSAFIYDYQALLFSMMQYIVLLKSMEDAGSRFTWTLEEAVEKMGEPAYRKRLFEAIDKLEASYDALCSSDAFGQIEDQLSLV